MPKSRASAAVSLLLVFVSGTLVGVLAHRAYVTTAAGPASPNLQRPRRDPADFRKHFVEAMQQRLKLDAGQVARLNGIMDGVEVQFREVREKWNTENQAIQKGMVEQVNAMLSPEQQSLYAEFRAERERERQKRMQDRRGPGGPPPGPPPQEKK